MSEATSIYLGKYSVGTTVRFRLTITKDDVAWAGADSVTLTFEAPDRETTFSRSAVVEDDSAGVWHYDTPTTDFPTGDTDQLGNWTLRVTVVDGAITLTYPEEISFVMKAQP